MRPEKLRSGVLDTTEPIVSFRPRPGDPTALMRGERPSGDPPCAGGVGRVTMLGCGDDADALIGDIAGAPPCGVVRDAASRCLRSASKSTASPDWFDGDDMIFTERLTEAG